MEPNRYGRTAMPTDETVECRDRLRVQCDAIIERDDWNRLIEADWDSTNQGDFIRAKRAAEVPQN